MQYWFKCISSSNQHFTTPLHTFLGPPLCLARSTHTHTHTHTHLQPSFPRVRLCNTDSSVSHHPTNDQQISPPQPTTHAHPDPHHYFILCKYWLDTHAQIVSVGIVSWESASIICRITIDYHTVIVHTLMPPTSTSPPPMSNYIRTPTYAHAHETIQSLAQGH